MPSLRAAALQKVLRQSADPERARDLQGFFKTGKGEYAEGDRFLGLYVQVTRAAAKTFRDMPLPEVEKLLKSPWHEDRVAGVFILVDQMARGTEAQRRTITAFYLKNSASINNWDLVDVSTPQIVGRHLFENRQELKMLVKLAASKVLWERRIAMLATFYFIQQQEFSQTLKIAELLLHDPHDLIHKAVGWMLREADKRAPGTILPFLNKHAHHMPRTMLRYSIERFPEPLRKKYMSAKAKTS